MKNLLWLLVLCLTVYNTLGHCTDIALSDKDDIAIKAFIEQKMKEGKIPGIAASVITHGVSHRWLLGQANSSESSKISSDIVFELGSNSKAFTGIAIQLLIQRQLFNLDTPVKEIIPWFFVSHQGQKIELKIRHLLYQTSGLPFKTIANITSFDTTNELETTVKTLVGQSLMFTPGEYFSYTTINYDVLGLVIEKASGLRYENFIKEHILQPLNMHSTSMPRNTNISNKAQGFKLNFQQATPFDAPLYVGHTPAAYIHSTLGDMEIWLQSLMDTTALPKALSHAIKASMDADRSVSPDQYYGSFYASGWYIYENWGKEISHLGSNPSFSSCITLRPANKTGIVILGNLNSNHVGAICKGIDSYFHTGRFDDNSSDFYQQVDSKLSLLFTLTVFISLMVIIAMFYLTYQIKIKTRNFQLSKLLTAKSVVRYLMAILLISLAAFIVPNLFFYNLPWTFIIEWAPFSLIPAVGLSWLTCFLIITYITVKFNSPIISHEEINKNG